MYARDQPRTLTIAIVVLQQQLPGLLVERRLRIGIDEKALHRDKDMSNPICRLPILLERVDTDLARCRDIRMEYFGGEPAWNTRERVNIRKDIELECSGCIHLGGAAGNSSVKLNLTLK